MHYYLAQFVSSVIAWLVMGLVYEFRFRRSADLQRRFAGKTPVLVWVGIGIFMIYNLVMWRRFP